MNKLAISPEALKDLEEIKDYISETLGSPNTALAVVARIINGMKKLRGMPSACPSLASKVPFGTDYRYLVCGNYLVFYRFTDKTVFVDRVLYGRRDYLKILFPELPPDDSHCE